MPNASPPVIYPSKRDTWLTVLIRYGRGSLLLVSPLEKSRFLDDVLARSPRLERQGDRLVLR